MKYKLCSKCGLEKTLNEFSKRYGKLQPYCKSCNNTYHRQHYKDNKIKYVKDAAVRKWQSRANALQFVMEYAKSGCEYCLEKDFRCLEFDHKDPTLKKKAISEMVSQGYGTKSIHKELQKCRILCANCHKKHTAEQFGWYKNVSKYFKIT